MTHIGEALFENGNNEAIGPCPAGGAQLDPLSHWYAAYTLPRHEKQVTQQLSQKTVETYLPLYETIHRWKDRRVRIELPLFPGYVFVHISIAERLKVLQVASVLRIVSFNGQAAALPDLEIEALKNALLHRKAEPYPHFAVGKRVRVHAGPLGGLEGVILRRKGNFRIVVTLSSIMQSIAIEVDASDLEVASSPHLSNHSAPLSPKS